MPRKYLVMSDEPSGDESDASSSHERAAEAFVDRARAQFGDDIAKLFVFGSTVRGETHGLASDVDVLVVLEETAADSTADALRDLAYDVMLEFGPVVELHVLSKADFEESRERANPFIRRVVNEGKLYG